MIKKANISWRSKQVAKMMNNDTIVCNHTVQRGKRWDKQRKSLLIHSMVIGYPMGVIFAMKDESVYSILDGKQRLTTIADFRNNEFELGDIPEFEIETENGIEIIDISGMSWEELPDAVKEAIDDYSITIYYFDELTDEEINEMFFRLNNNVPLTAIELTRVKTKSIEAVRKLAQHELFTSGLTKAAMDKYANEDIVMKSYVLMQNNSSDLSTKTVRQIMETNEWTEDDIEDLSQVYDVILKAYKETEDKKFRKRIMTRIHLISVVPIIANALKGHEATEEELVAWMHRFFKGERYATISDVYNDNAGSGSARKEAVQQRYNAMQRDLFHHDN